MKTSPIFWLVVAIMLFLLIYHSNAIKHQTPNILAVSIRDAKIMEGFPPLESQLVTKANMAKYPYIRWTLQHANQLFPTVFLAAPNAESLPTNYSNSLLKQTFIVNTKKYEFTEYAKQTSTDAVVILQNGKIVAEWYDNGMTPLSPHYIASITKSMTGLLAELMIYRKLLNPLHKVKEYLPELAFTPFGNVTVRQLLNMQVNVGVGEMALKPDQETLDMWRIMGWAPNASTQGMYEFLLTIKAAARNDDLFHYSSLTTEVAGWLISRVSGKGVEILLKEEILDKIGTTAMLYAVVDPQSKMLSSAGLNMSARDLARVGQMIANNGVFNGKQVIAQDIIQKLFSRKDSIKIRQNRALFENTGVRSYKSYWYQLTGMDNAIMGSGVFGQSLYINPTKNIVIVKFASQPADIIDEYNHGWFEIMFQIIEKLTK